MLNLLALAVFSPNVFVFSGGSPSTFCSTVAREMKQPVACLVYDDSPIRPFQLKWHDNDDFDRAIKPIGKQRIVRSQSGLSFYRGGLTSDIVDQNTNHLKGLSPLQIPDDANDSGKITLKTEEKSYFPVTSLLRLNLKKQLRIHWLFQRQAVAIDVSAISEKNLISLIGNAIGAKFSETDTQFILDFDPISYRNRLVESMTGPRPVAYNQYKWGQRYSQALSGLLSETVRAMSDAQLVTVFKTPNESVNVDAPQGSALYRAALKRFDAIEELAAEKNPSIRQLADGYIILLGQVDLSKPVEVIFHPPANCGALYESSVKPGTKIAL